MLEKSRLTVPDQVKKDNCHWVLPPTRIYFHWLNSLNAVVDKTLQFLSVLEWNRKHLNRKAVTKTALKSRSIECRMIPPLQTLIKLTINYYLNEIKLCSDPIMGSSSEFCFCLLLQIEIQLFPFYNRYYSCPKDAPQAQFINKQCPAAKSIDGCKAVVNNFSHQFLARGREVKFQRSRRVLIRCKTGLVLLKEEAQPY